MQRFTFFMLDGSRHVLRGNTAKEALETEFPDSNNVWSQVQIHMPGNNNAWEWDTLRLKWRRSND